MSLSTDMSGTLLGLLFGLEKKYQGSHKKIIFLNENLQYY
jgi:hypothetical protein